MWHIMFHVVSTGDRSEADSHERSRGGEAEITGELSDLCLFTFSDNLNVDVANKCFANVEQPTSKGTLVNKFYISGNVRIKLTSQKICDLEGQ